MAEQTLFDSVEQVKEEWRAVPGHEDRMQVSNIGRVRRLDGSIKSLVHDRYLRASFRNQGKQYHFWVHRLVALAFIGPCPDGQEVNHIDGVKTNNRIENLEYVTKSQNSRHAVAIGLIPKKEIKHSNRTHLTESQALQIQEDYRRIRNSRKVAKLHGKSQATICRVVQMGRSGKVGQVGDSHHTAKLNADKVREIRRRFAGGELTEFLAMEFGTGVSNIGHVVNRRNWDWVK